MVLVANKWDLKNEDSIPEHLIDLAAKNMKVSQVYKLKIHTELKYIPGVKLPIYTYTLINLNTPGFFPFSSKFEHNSYFTSTTLKSTLKIWLISILMGLK